jgi:hypothetical protein
MELIFAWRYQTRIVMLTGAAAPNHAGILGLRQSLFFHALHSTSPPCRKETCCSDFPVPAHSSIIPMPESASRFAASQPHRNFEQPLKADAPEKSLPSCVHFLLGSKENECALHTHSIEPPSFLFWSILSKKPSVQSAKFRILSMRPGPYNRFFPGGRLCGRASSLRRAFLSRPPIQRRRAALAFHIPLILSISFCASAC